MSKKTIAAEPKIVKIAKELKLPSVSSRSIAKLGGVLRYLRYSSYASMVLKE